MSTLQRLEDRYRNDATFHTLVDMLTQLIENMQLSASEVREAAMYAVYRQEMRRPGLIGPISELAREPEGGPYR
jgi:hypothetical protein